MSIKKWFASLFSKETSRKEASHHKKHGGFFGQAEHTVSENFEKPLHSPHRRRKFVLLFGKALAVVFLFFSVATVYAQAPAIQATITRMVQTAIPALQIKPKAISQANQTLSTSTQQAIQTLAEQEMKEEQAQAVLATTTADGSIFLNSLEKNGQTTGQDLSLIETIREDVEFITTRNPITRAKIKLRRIDRQIAKLQTLLTNDKSDATIDQAVKLIQAIGQQTGDVETDRETLGLQIEQYNRLQLILQQIEDRLPIQAYLKIEAARTAYLVKGAQASVNGAPNLDMLNSIGVKQLAGIVGDEFAELKTIEVLTDLEIGSGLKPETKEKLTGLQKELAGAFEKRMLKLPVSVRNRHLQNYIQFSYGNPINQVRSFTQIQQFLTDREVILEVENLKELALKRVEARLFELTTPELEQQFNTKILSDPDDIKILIQAQMDIEASGDQAKITRIKEMSGRGQASAVKIFGQDKNVLLRAFPNNPYPTVLDLVLVSRINTVLQNSPEVSPEVKLTVQTIKKQTIQNFVASVSDKGFATTAKANYNPVAADADVRLLLPAPNTILVLDEVQTGLPANERTKIALAQKAQASLLANHLLFHVNDPEIFDHYQRFISDTPQLKQLLQQYGGRNFFALLGKKQVAIDQEQLAHQQALYERMQQITQRIFLMPDNKVSGLEHQLSAQAIADITQLKKTLPSRSIPRLAVPEGVTLPEFASLPDEVQQAIVQAAKARIAHNRQPETVKLDLTLHASDLGIGQPRILPGSFLYPFKQVWRKIQLAVTFDPLARAQLFLQQSNEKTLEAATLLQKDQNQKTIGQVLGILDEVRGNFEVLKSKSQNLSALKKDHPEKVDALMNSIIANGLARQTLFSAVEDHVYGADFVKVERIRQQVLADGVSTLLMLSDNDAQVLVDKVEAALEKQSGSQFKELKAIELITEIKRTQPPAVGAILEASEIKLAKKFEAKLLALPKEERNTLLLAYASSFRGNPVRQFEAYEQLKDNFTNPETLLLVERLKDKAVENLRSLIAEISDASTLQEFVDTTVGDKPEDLKIITQIQLRVETHIEGTSGQLTPIEVKIEDIKAQVEENILARYENDPVGLAQTDFFSDPSHEGNTGVVDVIVARELEALVERSPEVSPEVIETVHTLENQVVADFIETVTNIETSVSGTAQNSTTLTVEEIQALEPSPLIIETLIELKEETSPAVDALIDNAIEAQVSLIEEQLATIDDPVTLETYLAQIEENPVVAEVIAEVGGSEFTHIIEQVTTEVTQTATQEQTLLEETVAAVQEEIFSAPVNNPAPVTETLSAPIQAVITEIQTEEAVPTTQIPETTVTVEATVTTQPVEPAPTVAPVSAPATETAPAPVQESAPAPVQEAPAPPPAEAPAAPAIGL